MFFFVATVVTPGGPPFDLTITGNNSYRPLTFTEKVFSDEWAKKISTTNNHSKEPIINNQQQGLFLKKRNFPKNYFSLLQNLIG